MGEMLFSGVTLPGAEAYVTVDGKEYTLYADAQGRFRLEIDTPLYHLSFEYGVCPKFT